MAAEGARSCRTVADARSTVKYFLISAPVDWTPDQYIRRFLLPTGEYVSCVLWYVVNGAEVVLRKSIATDLDIGTTSFTSQVPTSFAVYPSASRLSVDR